MPFVGVLLEIGFHSSSFNGGYAYALSPFFNEFPLFIEKHFIRNILSQKRVADRFLLKEKKTEEYKRFVFLSSWFNFLKHSSLGLNWESLCHRRDWFIYISEYGMQRFENKYTSKTYLADRKQYVLLDHNGSKMVSHQTSCFIGRHETTEFTQILI